MLVAIVLAAMRVQRAEAGGGPENVLLVVNPRSWASVTVANHFVADRGIAASNVLDLEWDGQVLPHLPIDTFRSEILEPVLAAIDERGLSEQIDYVVYSCDFPYSINARSDFSEGSLPRQIVPYGSLNSLTYLHELVRAKDPNYVGLNVNHYLRRPADEAGPIESLAFRSAIRWAESGAPVEQGGRRFLLSTLLAFTSGRGNSVREAIEYLGRATESDATSPRGTIYYMQNSDIRSKIRDQLFPAAVAALKELGVSAVIEQGTVPSAKDDVQGATMGMPTFDWQASNSTILPGAICEHLTSTAGLMDEAGKQTPISVLLRYGAAAASGMSIEPTGIIWKFPLPFIHVHYARGCSLAESYYQSVYGPAQLIIIGDPLCQPWARPPDVSLAGVGHGDRLQGTVEIQPTATTREGVAIAEFHLYVDGLRTTTCQPGEAFTLDSTALPDGFHELRVVAVDDTPIATQGREVLLVSTANHGRQIGFQASHDERVGWDEQLTLSIVASDAARVEVRHHRRVVGSLEGSTGEIAVDPRTLGYGPVLLHVVALDAEGQVLAMAAPLAIMVIPRPIMPALALDASRFPKGVRLRTASGPPVPIADAAAGRWLEEAGIKPGQGYALEGFFEVPVDDVYQFQVSYLGDLALLVDGREVFSASEDTYRHLTYIPLTLAAGTHSVQFRGTAGSTPRLELRFGGPGSYAVGARQFHYPP